jgi:hypothetical protein
MEAVINYLAISDPETAKPARHRYGKVQQWIPHLEEERPETICGIVASTEGEVVSMLRDLLKKEVGWSAK